MEKTAILNKYELVLIVDAKLAHEDKEAILKGTTDLIAKHGGKVINSFVWKEKQRFTFEIKKLTEGTYYMINFESAGEAIEKVSLEMRLNETILRSLIINVDEHTAVEAKS